MGFSSYTMKSLGKLPYSTLKNYNRKQYYKQRNIVKQSNLRVRVADNPDVECIRVPNVGKSLNKSNTNSYFRETSFRTDMSQHKITNEYKDQFDNEKRVNSDLQAEVFRLREINTKLIEDNKQVKIQYDEFIDNQENEIIELKEFEQLYNESEQKNSELVTQIKKLELELGILRKRFEEENSEDIFQSFKERIKELNLSKLNLTEEIDDLDQENNLLNKELSSFKETQYDLQNQIDKLEKQLEDALRDNRQL